MVLNEAVFVQYLDAGAWHLAFYNDGREREAVSFSTNVMGETESALEVVTGEGEGAGREGQIESSTSESREGKRRETARPLPLQPFLFFNP